MTGRATPDRAAIAATRAQRTLQPGSGKCVLCGEDIWRYYTSGASDRLTMFDERRDGSWTSSSEHADYVGPGKGWLFPHNCLVEGGSV